MVVQDILTAALALTFESGSPDAEYAANTPAILNVMVPEVFDINNELRVWKGMEPLTEWPEYKALEDDVVLEPELCRAALPYGLAKNLLIADEESARAEYYNNKYAEAVNACMRIKPEPVRDVYGDDWE